LFPPGGFSSAPPVFDFVCSEPNPLRGGTSVRSRLVLGGGGAVTDGMRLWAGLGWYEMAAYAVLRARCCASPPKLHWSFDLACPIDQPLAALEKAVAAGDKAATKAALDEYTRQAHCLNHFGQATNFGQAGSPGAGMVMFDKLLSRALP